MQTTGYLDNWRVQQYAANVYNLSQQKGSRLAPLVRKETFIGKAEFFDTLGKATAQVRTVVDQDTPNLDIAHERRMLTTQLYHWATRIDRKAKLAQIHNPESEYSVAARNALGRAMDDVIIAAALSTAATGESGTGTANIPNAGMIASALSTGGGGIQYLNVQALRKAKLIMDQNEVEGSRHIVCRAIDIENLLQATEITNVDYNTVKALVQGEINTFMGFNFIRSEQLIAPSSAIDAADFKFEANTGMYASGGTDISTNYALYKTAFAFAGDGIILGMNEGARAFIEPRPDKAYDMQVYASMDFGALRMEEAKVVPIFVKA